MAGIYLSIPFCRSKCTYCNFASGVFPATYHARYASRLEQDIGSMHRLASEWGASAPEAADTIYFGGGTPSLLAPQLLRQIFSALRREFAVLPTAEITMECAPGQIEAATLDAMLECGVNRVSLGVQSFVDGEARSTGRLHTRAIALEEIGRLRAAGVARISVDLIAGLPGQTFASWMDSLQLLVESGVDHASVYMLEVDEDSRLGRELLLTGERYHAQQVPPDDLIAEMYSEAIGYLAGHGLAQYEISNFARTAHESQHNLKYWRRQPYIGFGLDAHSMLRSAGGAALRLATTDHLDTYIAGPAWEEPHPLTREEELEETWFLGLRMNEGVSLAALRHAFSALAVHDAMPTILALQEEGLLALADEDRVVLTHRGRLLSNEVFSRFLAEPVHV